MTIKNKFDIGDEVYIIADADQNKQLVVGIFIAPNGLTYILSNDGGEFYDMELTTTKGVI